ncbi:hypothetical protein C8R46DRAFT_1286964 [Mycena filopes]|nr:hypothetical protein C8R46DRAFT_1286964 [Mycena filopes]
MHRCLGIVELLRLICTFALLDCGCSILAALARVCRIFEGPALDVVWRDISNLKRTFSCMPYDLFASPASARYGFDSPRLSRPIIASDWDRVLPLEWHNGFDRGEIRMLLSPTLEKISLASSAGGQLSILSSIARRCSVLKQFSIYIVGGDTSGAALAISSFLRTVQTLEVLELNAPGMVDWASVMAMANLPALQRLTLSSLPSSMPSPAFTTIPRFMTLRALSVGSSDVIPATILLRMFTEQPLYSFEITIQRCVPADAMEPLHVALGGAFSHSALTVLSMDHVAADVPTIDRDTYVFGESCIRPLLYFSNLKIVTITAPFGFALYNSTMLELAKAWPKIEKLALRSFARHQRPNVTLECLDAFARHCPRCQARLAFFHVGFSDVSSDSAPVSRFLRALFPSLVRIETSLDGSGGTRERHLASKATTSDFNADAHCSVLAEEAFIDAGAIASSNRATNGVSVGLLAGPTVVVAEGYGS